MNADPYYAWGTVVASALGLILALWHLRYAAWGYRTWHDQRAAIVLMKALGLAVMAAGLLTSAVGLLTAQAAHLSEAGLSVTRGALFLIVAILVLTDPRPGRK